MKAAEVRVGAVYLANVSDSRCAVRITGRRLKGWSGVNLRTGREVYVRGAQRLQRELTTPGAIEIYSKPVEVRGKQV